jgi:hypothetical protein
LKVSTLKQFYLISNKEIVAIKRNLNNLILIIEWKKKCKESLINSIGPCSKILFSRTNPENKLNYLDYGSCFFRAIVIVDKCFLKNKHSNEINFKMQSNNFKEEIKLADSSYQRRSLVCEFCGYTQGVEQLSSFFCEYCGKKNERTNSYKHLIKIGYD